MANEAQTIQGPGLLYPIVRRRRVPLSVLEEEVLGQPVSRKEAKTTALPQLEVAAKSTAPIVEPDEEVETAPIASEAKSAPSEPKARKGR